MFKSLLNYRRAGLLLALTGLLFAGSVHSDDLPSDVRRNSVRHPFEGFTAPFRSIEVAASDAGRIAEVGVKRGDIVKKGQLLLRLDSTLLKASRRVAAADAEASARISALVVEHDLQKERLLQFQALSQGGRGSNQELRRAEADEKVAAFNLQAGREEQKKAKLVLDEIDTKIASRSILSPINGVVTKVEKDVGEFVSPTQPEVVTVVDLSQLRATFYLSTSDAMRVAVGQKLEVLLPEMSRQVDSVVEYIGATTEADSGRVQIDVLIDNRKRTHRSGLRCLLQLTPAGITVGRTAVPNIGPNERRNVLATTPGRRPSGGGRR